MAETNGRFSAAGEAPALRLESPDLTKKGREIWRPQNDDELNGLITGLSQRLLKSIQERGFMDADLRLRTIIEEGTVNAWRHGNDRDPRKAITVGWCLDDDLWLEIIDEGRGFNPAAVPDPTAGENLTKAGGRGIFILNHFARLVEWSDQGRRLVVALGKTYGHPARD